MFTNMTIDVDMQKHGKSRLANGIPLWALTQLGKEVKLHRPFDEYGDGSVIHRIFTRGKLDAIQSNEKTGSVAVVELSDGDLVQIPFDYLEK